MESNVLAKALQDLKGRGVTRGDRVCVMCKLPRKKGSDKYIWIEADIHRTVGNTWEFAVLTYAVFKLGAILVCFSIHLATNPIHIGS